MQEAKKKDEQLVSLVKQGKENEQHTATIKQKENSTQQYNNKKQGVFSSEFGRAAHSSISSSKVKKGEKVNPTEHSQKEQDKDEEVNKCLKVAKQWTWNTVELSARTGMLLSRKMYSSACYGGSSVRDLFSPLWLRKRGVSNVQDSLGVNQQVGSDSDTNSHATQPDRLSSPGESPRSPVTTKPGS